MSPTLNHNLYPKIAPDRTRGNEQSTIKNRPEINLHRPQGPTTAEIDHRPTSSWREKFKKTHSSREAFTADVRESRAK